VIFISHSRLDAQVACHQPTPPEGVTLQYVGTDYGIATLSEAIADGRMEPCSPCTPNYPYPVQWIQIGGTFEFDFPDNCVCSPSTQGSYHFGTKDVSSRIIMEPDASIVIAGGPDFHIVFSNTLIYGCIGMWDKIQVLEDSRLSLNNVRIADGVEALYLEPGSQLDVRRCWFVNNLYGIRFNPAGNHNSTLFSCRHSTFEGDGQGLKSSHPQFFNWSFVGIEINNKVNVWDIGINVFRHIQNGIVANQSVLYPSAQPHRWATNVFHDIYPKGSTILRSFGNGIYVNESPIATGNNIHGESTYNSYGYHYLDYDENFKNCQRGVQIRNAVAYVFDNAMVQCDTAILVRESMFTLAQHKSQYTENRIEQSTGMGIGFLQNGNLYHADVSNNLVKVQSSTRSAGIWVFGNLLNQNIRIAANQIDIHTEGRGVDIESAIGVIVDGENIFEVQGSGFPYQCVLVHGSSHGILVVDNHFLGSDQGTYNQSTTPLRIGVDIEDAEFTMTDCNVFDNVGTSMSHKFFCTDAIIRSNKFRSGTDGYSLGSQATGGAFIGEQSLGMIGNRNEWPTTSSGSYYPSFDARSFHNIPFLELDNKFWVDEEDTQFNNNLYWPDKILSVSPYWFQADLDVIMLGVNNCAANLWPDPSEELTRIEQALLDDDLGLDQAYYNWRARWAFLHKTDRYPDLLSISGVSQWQQDMLPTPQGQLYEVQRMLRVGLTIPENMESSLDSLDSMVNALLLDLSTLDSIWSADNLLDSAQFASYTTMCDSVLHLTTEMAQYWSAYHDSMSVLIGDMAYWLNNILATESFDAHLRDVMTIWSSTLMPGDTLTMAQADTLEVLGNSCRFVDGPAVVLARALLGSRGHSMPQGDHPSCVEDYQEEAAKRSGIDENVQWSVYPSHTKGECLLVAHERHEEGNYQLQVYDLRGAVLYQGTHQASRQRLDLGYLPAGHYIIRLQEREQTPVLLRVVKL
jgi:hypothetical protein